jgi:hypothetical protein
VAQYDHDGTDDQYSVLSPTASVGPRKEGQIREDVRVPKHIS